MRKRITVFITFLLFIVSTNAQGVSDRTAFCLKGKVKRIVFSDGSAVAFNEKGTVISIKNEEGEYGKNIKRTTAGLISSVNFGTTGANWIFSYQGGKLNKMLKNNTYWRESTTFSGFSQGLPWDISMNCVGEIEMTKINASLQYGDFDHYGNWTWCRRLGTATVMDARTGDKYNTDYEEELTRTIYYY